MINAIERPEVFEEIITQDEKMHSLFRYVESISGSSQPVLITGETGVGKDLIARCIHRRSNLSGPFVAVNVAGLDDNVFSDTLFGHVKGAYTGAEHSRRGLIEKAEDGTIFLDEIGELSQSSQVKLLRLLQEGEYLPLGQDEFKKTNARVVAATNEDIWQLQKARKFRMDLNYRLRTHHINVPPLRERAEDIPALVAHFIDESSRMLNKEKPDISKDAIAVLKGFSFPGNIRELQGIIWDSVSRDHAGAIQPGMLKEHMERDTVENAEVQKAGVSFPGLLPTIREMTNLLVSEAMNRSDGNKSAAARLLGISRQALSKRLKKEGV